MFRCSFCVSLILLLLYLSIFSSNSRSVRTLICVLWGCSSDPVPEYVVWQIQSWLPFPHTNELLWNNRPSTWRGGLPPQTRRHISPSVKVIHPKYYKKGAKGGFFSESLIHFLDLQISKKKLFQKTILSLKFKLPTYYTILLLFKFQAQDSFLEYFFFGDLGDLKNTLHFLKKSHL